MSTEREAQQAQQAPLLAARAALAGVERYAQLDDDERLQAMASGLRVATACALVSIAENLDRLLDLLERGQ
jgi:hypothetical protein